MNGEWQALREEDTSEELGESLYNLDGMENYLTACNTGFTSGFPQAVSG